MDLVYTPAYLKSHTVSGDEQESNGRTPMDKAELDHLIGINHFSSSKGFRISKSINFFYFRNGVEMRLATCRRSRRDGRHHQKINLAEVVKIEIMAILLQECSSKITQTSCLFFHTEMSNLFSLKRIMFISCFTKTLI